MSATPKKSTEDYHGSSGEVDIINSTPGKAAGGASGGYTTRPRKLTGVLRQHPRPYFFSNTLVIDIR